MSNDELIQIPSFLTPGAGVAAASDACRTCQASCTTSCQVACMSGCEVCQVGCQVGCESCQGSCTTCQTGCQVSCQSACQSGCQGCQGSCQDASEAAPAASGSITSTSSTYSTITVTYTAVSGATSYRIYYRRASETEAKTMDVSGTTATITGLDASTAYVVNYRGMNANGLGPLMGSGVSVTTKAMIAKWSWTSSNGSASAAQTRLFYSVLTGDSYPENGFSYLVWNDLVDKANAVVTGKGNSWYSYKGKGVAGCKAGIGEGLSAAKYNEVRFNLDSIAPAGIGVSDVSAGDEVLGSYITKLTDAINSAIDAS